MFRPATLFLVFLALFFSGALVRSYILVHSRNEELNLLRSLVDQLQGKAAEKESTLSYYQSPEFIYKEALEQLGLTRKGEVIPVLPDWKDKKLEIEEKPVASSAAAKTEPLPYWKQWRALFFED